MSYTSVLPREANYVFFLIDLVSKGGESGNSLGYRENSQSRICISGNFSTKTVLLLLFIHERAMPIFDSYIMYILVLN